MKIQLKVSFQEKDQVKAIANENGSRIFWDKDGKYWYWETESNTFPPHIPAWLKPYVYENSQERVSEYFYICQPNTSEWCTVEYGPFTSKEEMAAKAISIANNAIDWEDAIIADNLHFVLSGKKIHVGKNINNKWIRGRNACKDSRDSQVKDAFARLTSIIKAEEA